MSQLVVNPRDAVVDPSLNNPLSQEDENPWNRFFQDNELRLTVKQDVIRTYVSIKNGSVSYLTVLRRLRLCDLFSHLKCD